MRLLTYFCVASVASSLQLARQSGAVESATDFLLDAKMQIQQMDDLKQDVEALSQDVQAGGDKAKWELLFLRFYKKALSGICICLRGKHLFACLVWLASATHS